MKKKIIPLALFLVCICMLAGCHRKHEWLEATCAEPMTCSVCGETSGSPLDHDWAGATCTTQGTCARCSAKGTTLPHSWTEATCISPKTCTVCGITGSNLLAEHQWKEATATMPKTCSVCGKQMGFSLNEDREDSLNHRLTTAEQLAKDGLFLQAIRLLDRSWKETGKQEFCRQASEYRFAFAGYNTSRLAAGENNSALLNSDGTVTIVGRNDNGELAAGSWTGITAISLGDKHIVGLKADGTVLAAGSNASGRCNVVNWQNVAAISAGDSHTVALTEGGTVLATGYDEYGQCQVQALTALAGNRRIVGIAAGYYHTAVLLEDGTAAACGDNRFGACNVQAWTDLAAIYAGSMYTAGLKTDGTVVLTGQYVDTWNTAGWTDIVNLAAGDAHLIGLKADGTVVSAGLQSENLEETHRSIHGWQDIVHISAGFDQTLAVTKSGVILCAGVNNFGQCDLAVPNAPDTAAPDNPTVTIGPGTNTEYVVFDHEIGQYEEYANVVGMDATGFPTWIHMTAHFEPGKFAPRIDNIGQIGSVYFLREDSVLTALNMKTGQAVWRHQNIEGVYDGQMTADDGSTHILGYSHDISITEDGTIRCSSENGRCRQHSVLTPRKAGKTAVDVRFDYFYAGVEYGNFVGLDKNKNPVWIYRSVVSADPGNTAVMDIGKYGNLYYLLDNGMVCALDVKTGAHLWRNSDTLFTSASCTMDTNGTIYLCDSRNADFVAISSSGETLARIDTFDEKYDWPYAIEKKSGKVYVIFLEGAGVYDAFAVNPRNFTYELIKNYPYTE